MSDISLPSSAASVVALRARVMEEPARTRPDFAAVQARATGGEAPKVIAFYLPQFHPIPENDAEWGEGFIEWTNVRRAQPNFEGYFQPRVPADFGYYDLRDPTVMNHQAELAASYGIYGLCYYYYYFSSKRVLEMPLERLLTSGRPAIPFCLAWANENWTRTWRGEEHSVILEHQYSEGQDRAVTADAFVSLHRSEGFGRGPAEAMLLGLPTIVTDDSGTADFATDECALLVKYRMVPVAEDE